MTGRRLMRTVLLGPRDHPFGDGTSECSAGNNVAAVMNTGPDPRLRGFFGERRERGGLTRSLAYAAALAVSRAITPAMAASADEENTNKAPTVAARTILSCIFLPSFRRRPSRASLSADLWRPISEDGSAYRKTQDSSCSWPWL